MSGSLLEFFHLCPVSVHFSGPSITEMEVLHRLCSLVTPKCTCFWTWVVVTFQTTLSFNNANFCINKWPFKPSLLVICPCQSGKLRLGTFCASVGWIALSLHSHAYHNDHTSITIDHHTATPITTIHIAMHIFIIIAQPCQLLPSDSHTHYHCPSVLIDSPIVLIKLQCESEKHLR